jgi:hypothetical protein
MAAPIRAAPASFSAGNVARTPKTFQRRRVEKSILAATFRHDLAPIKQILFITFLGVSAPSMRRPVSVKPCFSKGCWFCQVYGADQREAAVTFKLHDVFFLLGKVLFFAAGLRVSWRSRLKPSNKLGSWCGPVAISAWLCVRLSPRFHSHSH